MSDALGDSLTIARLPFVLIGRMPISTQRISAGCEALFSETYFLMRFGKPPPKGWVNLNLHRA